MIHDTLKQVILKSGKTHYRLAKETGVDCRAIDRFIAGGHGSNIGIRSAAALAEYFGLELKPIEDKKRKG